MRVETLQGHSSQRQRVKEDQERKDAKDAKDAKDEGCEGDSKAQIQERKCSTSIEFVKLP